LRDLIHSASVVLSRNSRPWRIWCTTWKLGSGIWV